MDFKSRFLPALKRAAWTAIEFGIGAAIIAIPEGAALNEVDWARLVSIALVATIVSLLKSILLSMPEVELESHIDKLKEDLMIQNKLEDGEGIGEPNVPSEVEDVQESDVDNSEDLVEGNQEYSSDSTEE